MKDRIKAIRKAAGLNQTEFGKALGGKSLSTVQKWEMGHNQPDASSLSLMCQKFGVSEAWLRTGAGEMRASRTREEEMSELVASLMAERPESFRSALVTTLLRFDPGGKEWEALESIYNSITTEMKKAPED